MAAPFQMPPTSNAAVSRSSGQSDNAVTCRPWRRANDIDSPHQGVRPWQRWRPKDLHTDGSPMPSVPTCQGVLCFKSYALSTPVSMTSSGCIPPGFKRTLVPSFMRMLTTICNSPGPDCNPACHGKAIQLQDVDVEVAPAGAPAHPQEFLDDVALQTPRVRRCPDKKDAALATLVHDLDSPPTPWSPKRWFQMRDMILQCGQLHLFRNLARSVQRSTQEALDKQGYVCEAGQVKLHRASITHVQWFGCLNAGAPPSLDDDAQRSGKIAPPLLICNSSALDVITKLHQFGGMTRPIVLVLELASFSKSGSLDLVSPSSTSPRCMPLRSDFALFAKAAEQQLRNSQSPANMRDHLCATHDPYAFLCPNVNIFRGSREEGYPFLVDPIHTHVIATAMRTTRPSVQLVASNATQMEWYADEADHTALLERLNLIGIVALKEATHSSASEADTKDGESLADCPSLVLGVPGNIEGSGLHHPRDAIANSLKHWRRRFSPYFRSVFVCCGGCGDPELAKYLDGIINRQVHRLAESRMLADKMCPWHWDSNELGLCVEAAKFERAGRMCTRKAMSTKIEEKPRNDAYVVCKPSRQSICVELSHSLQQASLAVRGCSPIDSEGASRSSVCQSPSDEVPAKPTASAPGHGSGCCPTSPSVSEKCRSQRGSHRMSMSIARRLSGHPTLLTSLSTEMKHARRISKSPRSMKSPSSAKKQSGNTSEARTAMLQSTDPSSGQEELIVDLASGAEAEEQPGSPCSLLHAKKNVLLSPISLASTNYPASLPASPQSIDMGGCSSIAEVITSPVDSSPEDHTMEPHQKHSEQEMQIVRNGGRRKSTGSISKEKSRRRKSSSSLLKSSEQQGESWPPNFASEHKEKLRRRSCEVHLRGNFQTCLQRAAPEDKLMESELLKTQVRRRSCSPAFSSPRHRRPSIEDLVGESGVVMIQRQGVDKSRTPKQKPKMRSNMDVEATNSELEIRRLVRERLRTTRASKKSQYHQSEFPAGGEPSPQYDMISPTRRAHTERQSSPDFGDSLDGSSEEGAEAATRNPIPSVSYMDDTTTKGTLELKTGHTVAKAESCQQTSTINETGRANNVVKSQHQGMDDDDSTQPQGQNLGSSSAVPRKSATVKAHLLAWRGSHMRRSLPLKEQLSLEAPHTARESLPCADGGPLHRIEESTEMSGTDLMGASGDDDDAGLLFMPRCRPVTQEEQITTGRRSSVFKALGSRNFHF